MDYKEPIQRKDITYCYVIITPKDIGRKPHNLFNEKQH